jgi:hypothetical protein
MAPDDPVHDVFVAHTAVAGTGYLWYSVVPGCPPPAKPVPVKVKFPPVMGPLSGVTAVTIGGP